MRCAIINPSTGYVENIILADPEVDQMPEGKIGRSLEDDSIVSIGWILENDVFVNPNPPVEPQVLVPESVTPRQCRLLLLQQGILADVETMIAGMDEQTRITWEYALEFRRDDSLLNVIAVNLNLTEEQIDEFFIAASIL